MKSSVKSFLTILFLSTTLWGNAQSEKGWSLKDCLDYVNENHTDVRRTLLQVELQKEEIKRLKMSSYPSISANTDIRYSFDRPLLNNMFSNSWNINSRINLYEGGRLQREKELAAEQMRINELSLQQVRDNLSLNIAQAYLNIILNEENVQIAREQVSVSEKLLQRTRDLVEAGTKARSDLYQAEARLAADKENLVKARNNKQLSLLELSRILQVPYESFSILGITEPGEPTPIAYSSGSSIYQYAEKVRPEIEIARKKIQTASLQKNITKSGILPSVSANYSAGTQYLYDTQTELQQTDFITQLRDERNQSISLSVNIPIFDKHQTKIAVQKAEIQRQIAEYDLESEKIRLRTTIETAYLNAQTSYNSYLAARVSVKSQEEAYRTAEERYNLGSMTNYDFEQVRNNLFRAKSNLITAKYNYLLRAKILDYYAGKSLE